MYDLEGRVEGMPVSAEGLSLEVLKRRGGVELVDVIYLR